MFNKKKIIAKSKPRVLHIGTQRTVVIALWALFICSFAFAVYKNFTAVDTHTVHETTVVQQEVTDTNAIESFVTNFAKVYYSWEQSTDSIEQRTENLKYYLTDELQALNADTVRSDVPVSASVQDVQVWSVEQTGDKVYKIVYSVSQKIVNEEESSFVTSAYAVSVYVDDAGDLVIIQNPTITGKPAKSDYAPKVTEPDGTVSAQESIEITEFLTTFFTLYPSASEQELSYYVKVALHKLSGNALSVLVGDLAAGESMTVTFDVQVLDTAAGTTLQNSVHVSGNNGSGTATDDGVTVPEVEPQNPTDPTGFYVTKDVDKTVVDVSKGAADEQKTATFTITVGNNGKEPWKNVVLKDMLDTSVVTPMLQDNVYVDGVLNNKWSFADKVFTLELGDIAPGAFHEVKLTVRFKADAGGKTYVNYATGAGDNGNAAGQSPEVEIVSAVREPVTDIHYQLFNGYGDGKWRPGDRISLQEACTVAYRLIANGGNTWLERGTVTVPDYEYTIPEEAKYFVSIGVLPASVFDTTQMIEDTDYEVNYEITDKGYLRIWATAAQLNTLVKYVTGTNAGVSGDVSRLTFAKVICQLTGHDTSPDTTGYSGNIQYYPDVASSVDLVTEVSHEHDYMLGADGNEYWI